ncbi:glycosyltransferase [Paenibacillus sp. LPE1-1-1.1]|uniref:glycosyltransferase n=1 Tax=Paenibacillus sp. LPE1-1-1.1 TaxID=3135230 RepID=UPI00341AB00D
MIVTTSICANYLPKAMVLAKSIKLVLPEVKFIVCLLEREVHPAAQSFEYFDEILLAKDLGYEDFDRFIFKHSIVEAATSVKGQLFVYLLDHYKQESKFVYLDPDIEVLSPLTELDEALDKHGVVLTPHLCHPEDIMDAVMDNELSALKHGVFNLGFLAISRATEEGRKFAEWWASRLAMFCYDDIPRGIFTDQKWVDLAPAFFNVHILKHPGYNAAPWNLSKRKMILDQQGNYIINNLPLRFFHFSGFDSGANEGMINKYVPDLKNAVYTLRDNYVKEMKKMGQNELGKAPWSYEYYESGEKIAREVRIKFRDIPEMPYMYPQPFKQSNEILGGVVVVQKHTRKITVRKVVRKLKNLLR